MTKSGARILGLTLLVGVLIAAVAVGLLVPWLSASHESAEGRARTMAAAELDTARTSKLRSQVLGKAGSLAEAAVAPATERRAMGGAGGGGALLAASLMPRSAELVLVIENAAELRSSRLGAAGSRFFSDAQGMAQSRTAWTALAAQLGWTEPELFDRLLGRRVVLVARPSKDGATMLWALLSDISMETDTRLKERLEASQRSIDQGHQVLSIEKGRFELTSHRHSPRQGSRRETEMLAQGLEPDVTIVLGPTGQSELFDEMVSVLTSGAPEPLGSADVLSAARAASPDPEILLIARLRNADRSRPVDVQDAPREPWSGFFVFSGKRGGDTDGAELQASLIYRDQFRRDENLAVPMSSDGVFTAISADSLFTVFQAAPLHGILDVPSSTLDFLRELPKNLPEQARAALAARQLFSLRRVESSMTASTAQSTASASSGKRVAAILALESTATDELARTLDGSIAGFVHNTLEQGSGLVQPTPYNFAGELPQIPRVLPIRMGEGNLLRLISPDPLALAWSYPRTSTEGAADGAKPGWWVVDIAPMPPGQEQLPSELHRAAVNAVVSASQGDRQRWVYLASARPNELESILPALIPDVGGFRTAMKRFEAAEVKLSISDSGDIRGDIKLKLGESR